MKLKSNINQYLLSEPSAPCCNMAASHRLPFVLSSAARFGANSMPCDYRNHKLTMLMSDSLGGSAKTLMFVNVSPTDHNIDESSNSLTYATRVRTIKNDISKNEASKDVMRLKRQVHCHVTVACVVPTIALFTSPSLLAAILHVLLQQTICYKAVSAMLACC